MQKTAALKVAVFAIDELVFVLINTIPQARRPRPQWL